VNLVEAALHRVADDLLALGVSWAVVGGFAVSARAEPRFTRDVDVAVAAAGDDEAESMIGRLTARGYRLIALSEQDAVGRLATARLTPTGIGGDIVVDVLFASSGIEPELAAEADPVELVPGLVVPVAQVGHLIALKLLARDDDTRPQDRADLRALLDAAGVEDIALAAGSVDLIRKRGFDRGRNLAADLAALIGTRGG
jgi:predicted nucleotidyltransferase